MEEKQETTKAKQDLTTQEKTDKTGKEKRARGVVTDRDGLACHWICEQGAMTVDQLWQAVWWSKNSTSPRYAYDRVLFLERSGFVEPIRTPFSLKSYFKATRLGQELALSRQGSSELVPLASPRVSEIPHVDGLTGVRLAVLRAGRLTTWKTDRVLGIDPSFPRQRFYSHIPDAIWTTPSGKRVAVEYERTRKGVTKLRQKVEAFEREMARPDRAMDMVLWIAVPGTISELKTVLSSHQKQQLRTMDQFLVELKTSDKTRGEE